MRRRLAFAALVAGLAVANLLAFRAGASVDLTDNRRFTLQPESLRIARALPPGVRVEAFLPPGSRFGREARTLLERYAERARGMRFAFVDPATEPARLLKEQVEPGQAIVRVGDKQLVVESVTEQALSSAFLRLLRERPKTVCFTAGHGEAAIDDEGPAGLRALAEGLRRGGYQVVALPPGALAGSLPPGCDLLVVAGPTTAFAPAELDAFHAYLRDEGKAFLLVKPPAYAAAASLSKPWGIDVRPGLVIDPAQSFQRDPLTPVVDDYPSFSPAVAGIGRAATVWPQTAGLAGGGLVEEQPGLYVSTLARTGDASWLEMGGVAGFQRETDVRGPVLVAASADYSEVGDRERRVTSQRARVKRTRLLVFGSVNPAANAFVDLFANGRLVLDGVAWLALDEQLIGLVPKPIEPRGIALTAQRRRLTLWWSIFVPVAVALGAAASAWRLRR